MISIKSKGDFTNTFNFITKSRRKVRLSNKAEEIAQLCVSRLKEATPVESGLTADSWGYEINVSRKTTSIIFKNTNIQNGVNVALLLEYGHTTATGGWVQGMNFVNPIIKKTYLDIIDSTWKELSKL